MVKLKINLQNGYNIYVGQNLLQNLSQCFNLQRKVLIITDDGVPSKYSKMVESNCLQSKIFVFPQGEKSKNIKTLENILTAMSEFNMDRTDCVVAVGGGVVGDISGLASSLYMRGIDFYNVPTTLLSQVDSSIGGKTAVDFNGIKNLMGAFYQPKGVVIDVSTLSTLDDRQFSNGISESVKMALTSDNKLFERLEGYSYQEIKQNIQSIIIDSLTIKKKIVEKDEKEKGLRRMLNFGHTIGHAIESQKDFELYHGECVAIGMVAMSGEKIRQRVISILQKLNLPTTCTCDKENIMELIKHDKKTISNIVKAVVVNQIGKGKIEEISLTELSKRVYENF